MAAEIQRCFEGADVLGYNALRFDVPLLAAEFARVSSSSGGGGGGSSATAASTKPGCKYQVTTRESITLSSAPTLKAHGRGAGLSSCRPASKPAWLRYASHFCACSVRTWAVKECHFLVMWQLKGLHLRSFRLLGRG